MRAIRDFDREERISEFWGAPGDARLRGAADRQEEDKAARAVFVGMLRKAGH
jgi:hypothetical protein